MKKTKPFRLAAMTASLLCHDPVYHSGLRPEQRATAGNHTSPAETEAQPETQNPFTPDGTGTVVDNATDQDGKEFYTITTPDENVFFLVIDNQKSADNVYFLNAVTEDDLLPLAEKGKENWKHLLPNRSRNQYLRQKKLPKLNRKRKRQITRCFPFFLLGQLS